MPTQKGRHKLVFYVFYDKNDFVRYFGTAKDLVAQGIFGSEELVRSNAYHQNKNRPGSVVKVPVPMYARRSVLNDEKIHRARKGC